MKQNSIKPQQRVLDTASRLFHNQGYNNTGINQIVEESGVVKSSLYQHYRSKEDIAIAFLNARHQSWFDKLKGQVSGGQTEKDKVLAAFDFIVQMNREEGFRGCAFLNMLSEINDENTRILEVIQAHKEELRGFFRNLLVEISAYADMVYLLFESAITESKLFKSDWPVESGKSFINSIFNS